MISEMLDRLGRAYIFTKLDLRNGYHLIQSKECNEYKTGLRTQNGQFEYQVMPFDLTNSPATFQSYIDDCLQSYIDDCLQPYVDNFAACYLDDTIMYATNQKEREAHVQNVLERLWEFGLYCKAEQC